MRIYIGADHNGFTLKEQLERFLRAHGFEVFDEGDDALRPNDDFPQFAARVVRAMQASDDDDPRGILICGSGQGMCMAANRYKGIRACLGYDIESARSSRNDDDANILCLPAHILKSRTAERIVRTWLETPFAAAPRFIRRIDELDTLG